jgi:hypothetical protein
MICNHTAQVSHTSSRRNISSGSDYISENWREAIELCVDMSSRQSQLDSGPFLRHFDRLLGRVNAAPDSSGVTGVEDTIITPFDRPCLVSLRLLRSHVACVGLGLASPLQFVVNLLRDVLIVVGESTGTGECDTGISRYMQTALKCALLEILAIKAVLDDVVATASQRHSDGVSASTYVCRQASSTLRTASMQLLEGEELGAETRGCENEACMDVWVAYLDAELAVGNASRALKVSVLSYV